MTIHLIHHVSSFSEPEDGIVSRKLVKGTILANFLIGRSNLQLLRAGLTWAIGPDVETAVDIMNSVGTGAGIHSSFESALVTPAIEEVTVEPVALGISLSPNEAVEVLDGRNVVEELEEDGEDGNWMRFGAHSGVVVTNSWESNLPRD
jgi:hypothetical protein